MKILMIAQEPELAPDKIVTGNAIRAHQLSSSVRASGHEITQVWFDRENPGTEGSFSSRDELRDLLLRHQADVYLVNFWELLDLIPFDSPVPLVLDFIAPRPLEQLFENPGQVQHDLHRLKVNLSKVDLVMVGNEAQKQLLLISMLGSGFDLRNEAGIAVVPLAADMVGTPASDPDRDGWTLVSGGVNWPWRNSQPYWDAILELDEATSQKLNLVRFGGKYSLNSSQSDQESGESGSRPLEPYSQYSNFLLNQANIGMELAVENIERRYSQSFRSLEFLHHGLPVICNRYLPIAADIEKYDAGWLIDSPQELPGLLRDITGNTPDWKQKSKNAEQMVLDLSPARAAAPLIQWLASPHKAQRLQHEAPAIAQLMDPPPIRRIRKILGLMANSLRRKIFLAQKRWFGGRKANGIVFVTRGDIFPADHGAAVKIIETARGLSRHDRPVALVTDDRRYWWQINRGEISRHRVPFWLRLATWPSIWVKLMHFTKDIPESNAFLYLPLTDGSFFWRTIYAGKQVGASIIQAEFPAYVRPSIPASHVLDARVIMVEHNVEYNRIKAQVPELTDEQYRRYKAIEIDMANQSDAVICVSDNDRQQLAVDGVALGRLHTIPHGVDLEQFKKPAISNTRERFNIPDDSPILVYHGTFAYPPNLQALDVFANELLPRLEARGLSCHVLAVGRQPPASSPHPRIHLTGSVENVAPWLKAADIAVVPLLEGGGTRMKIIDCFAAGIPVISTAKGIEGIPAINGEHALIIDDWDEMSAAIEELIRTPEKAAILAGAALNMASKLDWKSIAAEYIRVYESL
ncbi:MAG: glycosyltransferase involved in cell wall biosynthesis [Lysobacterales bacterium]|jgi:glycosyltransferase involved in cell wall biosynthesis